MARDSESQPEDMDRLHALAGPAMRARRREWGTGWRWLMVGVLMLGSVSTMLTATIVNVALPSIIGVFALGQDQAQWVSSAFLTASTAFMLLNAWAVSALGARAAFVGAICVFICGGVIGAGSQSLPMLVAGRALQGAGAGLIQPLAMLLIVQAFDPARRGAAIGVYALGVIFSPAFGPVIGGMMIDAFDWRVVFVATSPLAIVAAGGALLLLPGREGSGRAPPLDWIGLLLAVSAIALALQGLSHGHREGWSDAGTVLRFCGAAAAAGVFVVRAGAIAHPILDLAVFRAPGFARACVMLAMTGLAVYGSTYLIPLHAQMVQGYPPVGAGLMLLPAGLAMAVAFPLAGRMTDRMDSRWLLAGGVIAFGMSMLLMSGLDVATPFLTVAAWAAVGRLGVGMLMPAANACAMRLADPAMLAHAAPATTLLTQTGGVAGIGGLAVLLQERTAFHAQSLRLSLSDEAGQVTAFMNAGAGDIGVLLDSSAARMAFRECFALLAGLFIALLLVIPAIPARSPK